MIEIIIKILELFSYILFIALFGLSMLFIFKGMVGVIFGASSEKWPVIKGVIIKSKVIKIQHKNGLYSYAAKIHYKYWVKQKSYTGKRVGFSNHGSLFNPSINEGVANYISNQYPKGDAIKIHYHPKYNSLSVLEPGFSWWSVLMLFTGLLSALLFAAVLVKIYNN